MKSVLMCIQPKWCELIASGKKTVEVRKTRPKLETPFKVYIYCTQTKTMGDFILCKSVENVKLFGFNTAKGINKGFAEKEDIQLKGKVIGEFVCEGIIKIGNYQEVDYSYMLWVKDRETTERLCKDACLNEFAIQDYLGQNGGFGWRISNLVIYDKPKELSKFYTKCNEGCENCDLWRSVRVNSEEFDMDCSSEYYGFKPLKRPPQSWCYVEKGGEG